MEYLVVCFTPRPQLVATLGEVVTGSWLIADLHFASTAAALFVVN